VLDIQSELRIPTPSESVTLTMRDGAEIRLRRYGNPSGTRLTLSHGNGLAINAYVPFWGPLSTHFDVVVFDARNHGKNPVHDAAAHNWPMIFQDFEEIFQGIQHYFGKAPTVGVFHSLSAIASLQHTLAVGARWAALALFDPPIFPRVGHSLMQEHIADIQGLTERSKRRPQSYQRPEDFAKQLARLPQFARLVPQGPMLLACHTLRETADGRWELRNPREFETHLYLSQNDATLWPRMRNLEIPTILIGGDPAVSGSPAANVCAAIHCELGIEYEAIPNTTHFLQIEEPQACRDVLIGFLRRHGLFNLQLRRNTGSHKVERT
jgi:pimeloyl-ACP methyl ester carboxylesterase